MNSLLVSWESIPPIPFKSQISSYSLSDKHLFLATFSGSIFTIHLESFKIELHISFSELVLPIKRLLIFSDIIKEIRGLLVTNTGVLYYLYCRYNEQLQIIEEKTQFLSNRFENNEVLEIVHSQVMGLLIMADKKRAFYYMIALDHETNQMKVSQEGLIFETEEEIFQIDLSGTKVLISTFRNYYLINIFSKTILKIGSKEKMGYYGSSFLTIQNEEYAFAGRNQGIIWKIDVASGKVLTSLQFMGVSNTKLKYGRFFSLNNGILLSFDGCFLNILDLRCKSILLQKELPKNTILLISPFSRKKKSQTLQRIFLLSHNDGEISLEIGRTVTINDLLDQAFLQKKSKEIKNLLLSNSELQNIDNLRKWEEITDFNACFKEKEVLEMVEKIEKEWIYKEKKEIIDLRLNITRKEEPRILKERTKISPKLDISSFHVKIIEVSHLKSQNSDNIRQLIKDNYENNSEKSNSNKKNLKKNSPEYIRFMNDKISSVLKRLELKIFKREFSEKMKGFLNKNKNLNDFKQVFQYCMRYEDIVLKNFIVENLLFLKKYEVSYFFFFTFAKNRFTRSLLDRKNACFYIEFGNRLIRILYKGFLKELEGVRLIKEQERSFIKESEIFLGI